MPDAVPQTLLATSNKDDMDYKAKYGRKETLAALLGSMLPAAVATQRPSARGLAAVLASSPGLS